IGIVVDDAIVVVENVERNIALGLSPRAAAAKHMDQDGRGAIAIALVLSPACIPTALIPGISGKFYRQFALTIAASTIISAFNSLTLSPALCALLLKPHAHGHGHSEALPKLGVAIIGGLVAYMLLAAPIGHLFGIEVGGHESGAVPAAHSSTAAVWGLKAGVFAVGLVAGYFVATFVNMLLGVFFR